MRARCKNWLKSPIFPRETIHGRLSTPSSDEAGKLLLIVESMSDDNQANQSCGGKKKAMLAYGLTQISATVVSAISLAAIAISLCPLKQQSTTFNGCVSEIIAQGQSNAQAVRHCNGG